MNSPSDDGLPRRTVPAGHGAVPAAAPPDVDLLLRLLDGLRRRFPEPSRGEIWLGIARVLASAPVRESEVPALDAQFRAYVRLLVPQARTRGADDLAAAAQHLVTKTSGQSSRGTLVRLAGATRDLMTATEQARPYAEVPQ
ncbi:hypothetical protein ACIQVO_37010 [Streptomyces sp. NPDC101062]|uniref:hypothetical protein n=1 Tax=unclassified Streptomyces TaxID=2593676 RepID=UPI00382A62E2